MLKHLQGSETTKKLNNGHEVYVCSFYFAKEKINLITQFYM